MNKYALLAHKELERLAGEYGHEILYGVLSITVEMHTSSNEGKKGKRIMIQQQAPQRR